MDVKAVQAFGETSNLCFDGDLFALGLRHEDSAADARVAIGVQNANSIVLGGRSRIDHN